MSRDNTRDNNNNDTDDKEAKEERQKLEKYDERLYHQQKQQVQHFLPLAPNPHQNQQQQQQSASAQGAPPSQEPPPPNLFPHQSYPMRYVQYPHQFQGNASVPGASNHPQSAPLFYRQHPNQVSQLFFYAPPRSISFNNYSSNIYNPPSFNFPSSDRPLKLQTDKRSFSSFPSLERQADPFKPGSSSTVPSSVSSQEIPTIQKHPQSQQHVPQQQHREQLVPFASRSNVSDYHPMQQPPPVGTPFYTPHQQHAHAHHHHSQQQQPFSGYFQEQPPINPFPQIYPTPQHQHQHQPTYIHQTNRQGDSAGHDSPLAAQLSNTYPEKVVLLGSKRSTKEFFPKRDSSSSEDSDVDKPLVVENQVYSEQYLKSLMKDLKIKTQESSDTNFLRLCYLLEVDCCSKKSDGTEPYICDPLDSLLLTNFINNTAPWLDAYCHVPMFSKYLPQLSLCEDTSIIYNCLLSCGALYLHRDRPDKFDLKFALKYYNSALKLLSMKILQPDRVLSRCLICSVLLNHYEDFAGEVQNQFNHHSGSRIILQEILNVESNNKKRKYKPSSSATLGSKQVDLNKLNSLEHNEFLESVFWVITNNDLQESLKWEIASRWSLQNPNTTVLSLASNIDYDEKISEYVSTYFDIDFKRIGDDFFKEVDELWWLRKSAYNLQLINDYCNQPFVISHQEYVNNLMIQKWVELKKMNDIYGKFIPASLRRVVYREEGEHDDSKFPQITFKNTGAAITNLNYHLSCLLLYDSLIKRSGLFSQDEDEVVSASKILNESDKDFLTNKKNLKQLIKQHAISIIGILKSYHCDNVVWSLNLGHFKIALKFLRKYDEFHSELDPLITEIQQYTRTRFNKI